MSNNLLMHYKIEKNTHEKMRETSMEKDHRAIDII